MAFLFDEVNDYITLSGSSNLSLGTAWTIAGWVKLTDNVGTSVQYLLSSSIPDANPSFNWRIVEASSAITSTRNELNFNLGDTGTTDTGDVVSTGQPFLSNTNWTHIALSKSGSTITQYINGSADGSITDAAFGSVTITTLYVGARSDLSATAFFGGSMAEWSKWDRALSTTEIGILADAFSAQMIFINQSADLRWYVPMIRVYQDIGKAGLTVTNSGSTITDHPRIIRPNRGFSSLHPQTIATQDIILSGIASSGALGTSSLELNITGSGLASGSAIGTASLTTDDTINCSGISSTNAFGTSVITRDNTIDMTGLSSSSAFGTSVVANTQILTLTGISTTEAFGTGALSNVVVLEPSGISSTEQFGETTLNNTQIIELTGISSSAVFGSTVLADLGFSLITPTTGDFEQQLW